MRSHPELDTPLSEATLVIFDLEMTGMNPRHDRVVALGAVRIRSLRLTDETYFALVDPGRPIPATATQIHGIADADVAGKPTLPDVLPDFRRFVGGAIPVGHTAQLDLGFLRPALRRARLPSLERVLDTAVLASTVMPAREDISLEGLCAYFGIEPVGRHTALGDAVLTARVFLRMYDYLAHRHAFTLERALHWADTQHAYAGV